MPTLLLFCLPVGCVYAIAHYRPSKRPALHAWKALQGSRVHAMRALNDTFWDESIFRDILSIFGDTFRLKA